MGILYQAAPRRSLKWCITYRIGGHSILDSFCAGTKTIPDGDSARCCATPISKVVHHISDRLQDSPYFYVFKYARAVKQKVWNEAENRERVFSLSPHTPYGRVRLARFARIRLLRHALPTSLLILRKKPTVLQSTYRMGGHSILDNFSCRHEKLSGRV